MLTYWLLLLMFAAGAIWSALNVTRNPITRQAPGLSVSRLERKTAGSNRLLVTASVITAILVGLRYEVGTDWDNYAAIFDSIAEMDYFDALGRSDLAYATINWIAAKLGADIWLVNLVCATLLMFGVMRFARAQPNPWLAVAVAIPYLIIVVGMGYTRQAVAIGLGMAGLVSVSRGSFGRFVLWVLVAALFHRTAVILIPLVAIAYSRNRFQTVVIGLIGCLVGYWVLTRGEGLQGYESRYVTRAMASQGAGIRLAMNVPPALLFLLQSRRFSSDEAERKLWRLFSLIAVVSFVLLSLTEATTLLDRLALYIIPLQLFVLSRVPTVFGATSRQSGPLTLAVLLYSVAIQLVWFTFASNARNWVPYQISPIQFL